MPLITIEEGAARLDAAREQIEAWIRQGLLAAHDRPLRSEAAEGKQAVTRWVDEDELADVADSQGWLMLSGESWVSDGDAVLSSRPCPS